MNSAFFELLFIINCSAGMRPAEIISDGLVWSQLKICNAVKPDV